MQFCGIKINSVTYFIIVMAIGLLVDFLMHMLLRYYETKGRTRHEKVKETLETMGSSIMLGGFTTWLGVVPLALSTTKIFMVSFRPPPCYTAPEELLHREPQPHTNVCNFALDRFHFFLGNDYTRDCSWLDPPSCVVINIWPCGSRGKLQFSKDLSNIVCCSSRSINDKVRLHTSRYRKRKRGEW